MHTVFYRMMSAIFAPPFHSALDFEFQDEVMLPMYLDIIDQSLGVYLD